MSFGHADYLGIILVLPAAVALGVALWVRRRRRAARALGDPALLGRLGAGDLARIPWRRAVLVVGAAAALGIAVAGPRWGLESVEEEGSAADLVLALDVSKSMWARDVSPNRLERTRVLARRVLRALPGDRIGLVAFAGRAYTLSPLTVDHGALQLYLDALDPEIVSQGGSSLAVAIAQAADLSRGPQGAPGTVLLVTDGEALDDREAVRDAALRAAELGVTVHTVGVGTAEGAPLPVLEGGQETYRRGPEGDVVISRLDEPLLQEVARVTGGRFARLGAPGASQAVLSTLQGLDRTEGESTRRVREKQRYAWFVALALALLLWDGGVRARPRESVRG